MERWARIGTLTAFVALAFGCDRQTEVQRQTHDLAEAQKNVPKMRQELETQLQQAQADVVRLEQKVALARQGLTDDVIENQKELQAALQEQEHRVENELGEAKREAQIHVRDSEAALKTLGQTTTPSDPAAAAPVQPLPPSDPALTPSAVPREDLVPVNGADPEPARIVAPTPAPTPEGLTPEPHPVEPTPPPPPQPSLPLTDPTGSVPPTPPRTTPGTDMAPSDLAPPAPAPAP